MGIGWGGGETPERTARNAEALTPLAGLLGLASWGHAESQHHCYVSQCLGHLGDKSRDLGLTCRGLSTGQLSIF